MAHPYHHALSSVKQWGGTVDDYLPIHNWFDETKALIGDFRHRALRHHSEGIFLMESIFGATLQLSTCARCGDMMGGHDPRHADHVALMKLIPTRWVGEQHCMEDFGRIPSATEWLEAIQPAPWMVHGARKLSRELAAG